MFSQSRRNMLCYYYFLLLLPAKIQVLSGALNPHSPGLQLQERVKPRIASQEATIESIDIDGPLV